MLALIHAALTLFPLPNGYHPPATVLDNVADLLLLAGVILMAIFTFIYGFFFRWRRTAAGKSVFFLMLAISVLLLLNVTGRFTGGDYPGRDIARVVVYAGIPAAMIYMLVTLVRNFAAGGPLFGAERRDPKLIARLDPRQEPAETPFATAADVDAADPQGEKLA